MFIAHRGLYNDNIVENTMEAFDNAFNNCFAGIEFDIRMTKDNEIVIYHDSFLSRLSNKKGLLKDYNYSEIKTLKNGIIPLFKDVIKKYKNKYLFIELKEKIDIIKYLDDNNYYYIMSFNYDYIKDIPKSSNYKIGIINNIINSNINYKKIDFICILDSLANPKIIKLFEDINLEVVIYGIIGKINNYNSNLKYIK